MTQQINLFAREVEEKRGPFFLMLGAGVLTAVLCIAYWQYLVMETRQLQAHLTQSKSELASRQAGLKAMKDILATRTDPVRLAAELAAVKARASEAQEFLATLKKGDLGTLEGYGGHLTALARISEPGVWLTGVKIHNAGRTLEVQGRALQPEAVLRYAGEFNKRFAPYGASLTSLELTPFASENVSSAVTFKLF